MSWGPFSLEGKVALVTGAGAGIGLDIARRLGDAGAQVIGLVHSDASAVRFRSVLPQAKMVQGDLGERGMPERLFADALHSSGRIDILVNNAAIIPSVDFVAADLAVFDDVHAVNLRAPAVLIQALARHCVAARHGAKVVNISSMAATMTSPGLSLYGAAKGGLITLTRHLARELGPLGIHVNAIAPGVIFHDNLANRPRPEADQTAIRDEVARLIARTNMRRTGVPEEIANAVVFLASPASDYVSGQTLFVDGGLTAN